jgi:hypothetical protein
MNTIPIFTPQPDFSIVLTLIYIQFIIYGILILLNQSFKIYKKLKTKNNQNIKLNYTIIIIGISLLSFGSYSYISELPTIENESNLILKSSTF